MAVNAIVFKGAQLGVESAIGTAVAADKRLQSLGFSRIKPMADGGEMFRAQGNKLPTVGIPPGEQWSEIDVEGRMTFNEMTYYLCSAIKNVSPSADGTNGKKWEWSPSLAAADTRKSYTYENGYSTKAQKVAGLIFDGLTLDMSRRDSKISGGGLAGKRLTGQTMTGSPTEIVPKIIKSINFDVYFADTQAGLDSASRHALTTKATFTIPKNLDALFRMYSTDTTWTALVEQALAGINLGLTVGDDASDYEDLVPLLDSAASKWIRIINLGDAIAGATASQEKFQLDFCGKLIKPEDREEEKGAALNKLTFENVYDSTSGYSFKITLINTLASL